MTCSYSYCLAEREAGAALAADTSRGTLDKGCRDKGLRLQPRRASIDRRRACRHLADPGVDAPAVLPGEPQSIGEGLAGERLPRRPQEE